jgi:crossover junction endodeoxyribonuclease RusA
MAASVFSAPCRAVGPACFTIELPPGLVLLTANERPHWSRRAAVTGGIRVAAATLARAAQIPAAEQAWITVVLHPHNRRRLDPHNWGPSAKAAIDGLVDAGILPDDDWRHLLAVTFLLGPTRPARQLSLHITPVAAHHAAPEPIRTRRASSACPA